MKHMKQKKPGCCPSFWAMMCHLSTFFGFFVPGFSLFAPLLIWGLKRDQDPLIMENGRNVINFILSFWLYAVGLIISFFGIALLVFLFMVLSNMSSVNYFPLVTTGAFFFWPICFATCGLVYAFFHIVLPIYGGLKAFNGEIYRYPFTIEFLKGSSPIAVDHKSLAK